MVRLHTRACHGRDIPPSQRAVQDAIGLGSCSCQGHGFSGRPGHQRVMGDLQLSGSSAFVCLLQLLGDISVPWHANPAGAVDAAVPSQWVQPQMWLYAQAASGQLVAEVSWPSRRKRGETPAEMWGVLLYACTSSGRYCGHLDFYSGGRVQSRWCKEWLNHSHCALPRGYGGMGWSGSSWCHRAHAVDLLGDPVVLEPLVNQYLGHCPCIILLASAKLLCKGWSGVGSEGGRLEV